MAGNKKSGAGVGGQNKTGAGAGGLGKASASDPLANVDMGPLMSENDLVDGAEGFEPGEPISPDMLDLFGQGLPEETTKVRKSGREQSEWGGTVRAIVADLSPAVGLRFRAWAVQHKEDFPDWPKEKLFALYIEHATYRDCLADELRDEAEQQYSWKELHLEGLRPMIESEIQAQREAIAKDERGKLKQLLRVLVKQGTVPKEAQTEIEKVLGVTEVD